jgi:hypothetical protein
LLKWFGLLLLLLLLLTCMSLHVAAMLGMPLQQP